MSDEPPPPDVQAMRKARMNSEIVRLCMKRNDSNTHPVSQGIGLYTHVASPMTTAVPSHSTIDAITNMNIELLPLGGPRKMKPSKSREPRDKDLDAIYRELQDAVKAEEELWKEQTAAAESSREAAEGGSGVSLAALKRKYGDIREPASTSNMPQHGDKDKNTRRSSLASSSKAGGASTQPEIRRQSTGSVSMAARNSGSERRASTSNNEYNVYRDPRRQGR